MIVVTGGAGFIGSNILAALQERGERPVVIDWLGNDDKWKNVAKRSLYDIILPEEAPAFFQECGEKISAIVHMGAISTTTEKDVDKILMSNIRLTWNLWQFCCVHQKRFIFASSAATYGGGEKGFVDHDSQEYLDSLRPLNPYGWSKAFIDRKIAAARDRGEQTPPQYAGLKFFNVYGPNEYHKGGQKSVIAHIYPDAATGKPVRLFKSYKSGYADGGQLRDFIWVGDIVDVILWLLDHPEVSGLFNVGTGKARSFYDLAAATQKALGMPVNIEYIDMPDNIRNQYQYYTQADMKKLRAAGYSKPMTSLEEGVTTYVQKYLHTDDPYR